MSIKLPYNENDLLKRLAKGDEWAFERVFEHHKNRVYSIAFKLMKSTALAEEVVQEVFLIIWVKRAALIDVQNFEAYLFIITKNHVYKTLKIIAYNYKKNQLIIDKENMICNDAEDNFSRKELRSLLTNAIGKLSPQQKRVYILIKEEGLKREKVANMLHLTPETVKFHLAQAVKNIRAFCRIYISTFIGIMASIN